MPIYKYKSFEEAERALWNFRPDSDYYLQVSQLFEVAFKLAQPKNTHRIFEYNNIDEAHKDIFKKQRITQEGREEQDS